MRHDRLGADGVLGVSGADEARYVCNRLPGVAAGFELVAGLDERSP